MRRLIPGLHSQQQTLTAPINGLLLVRIEKVSYLWHSQKPFYTIRFVILEPPSSAGQSFSARLYCTERALWKLHWFLRDFGYDPDLLARDQLDEKALIGLCGIVRTTCTKLNGRSYQNLEAFYPRSEWEAVPHLSDSASTLEDTESGL